MKKTTLTRTDKTKRLALSGILISMATVLSFIKVFEWPFGGSITAASMLPLVMLGYTYGVRWGITAGLVHGVIQAITGATMTSAFAGQNAGAVIVICLIDYLIAYSVLGTSGIFKGRIRNHTVAFALGTAVAVFLRYICHVISGYIFFRSYADWFFGEVMANDFSAMLMEKCSPNLLGAIYSLIYNAAYMLPELIITTVCAVLIISLIPPVKKEMIK